MNVRGVLELVKEAAPAMGGTAATGLAGAVAALPTWLIGIGQAAIVVIFTVKAIDKRLERIHIAANEAKGATEILDAKICHLPCMTDPAVCRLCRERMMREL